jgi:hypothetical protein
VERVTKTVSGGLQGKVTAISRLSHGEDMIEKLKFKLTKPWKPFG